MILTPVPDCLQIIEILRPVGLLPRLGLPFNRPHCTWISHEDHKYLLAPWWLQGTVFSLNKQRKMFETILIAMMMRMVNGDGPIV